MSRTLRLACLLVLCLAILTVAVGSAVKRLAVPTWGYPVLGTGRLRFQDNEQIGQSFTAPWPRLSGIQVALAQEGEPAPCTAIIHLKTDPHAQADLWAQEFSLRGLTADALYRFDLEPLRESSGKRYYFALEAPACSPGSAPSALWDPGGALEGSSVYRDGQPLPGALRFQTFYSLTTWDKVDLMLSRMAEGRPYVLGRKGLYAGMFVVWAVVLVLIVVQMAEQLALSPASQAPESRDEPDQCPPAACTQSEEDRA